MPPGDRTESTPDIEVARLRLEVAALREESAHRKERWEACWAAMLKAEEARDAARAALAEARAQADRGLGRYGDQVEARIKERNAAQDALRAADRALLWVTAPLAKDPPPDYADTLAAARARAGSEGQHG